MAVQKGSTTLTSFIMIIHSSPVMSCQIKKKAVSKYRKDAVGPRRMPLRVSAKSCTPITANIEKTRISNNTMLISCGAVPTRVSIISLNDLLGHT